MNFSSHIKILQKALRACLLQDKHEMLTTIHDCLSKAKVLLKTNQFDYYLEQFEQLEINEFATTHYGVNWAKVILKNSDERDSNTKSALTSDLLGVCENVLTYTVDDCCMMQTEFHWYYCIGGDFVFKESQMGVIEAPNNRKITGSSRVAKISELPFIEKDSLI